MNERTMLEAAARAAGLRVQWDEGTGGFIRLSDSGVDVDSWNPLEDGEDCNALAAAGKLNTMRIIIDAKARTAAETRRAIVLAASTMTPKEPA